MIRVEISRKSLERTPGGDFFIEKYFDVCDELPDAKFSANTILTSVFIVLFCDTVPSFRFSALKLSSLHDGHSFFPSFLQQDLPESFLSLHLVSTFLVQHDFFSAFFLQRQSLISFPKVTRLKETSSSITAANLKVQYVLKTFFTDTNMSKIFSNVKQDKILLYGLSVKTGSYAGSFCTHFACHPRESGNPEQYY